ncbi:regulatory protein RecX [Acetobacter senegalensis]|uniref:hypothetical protein n=1 Tax=Acetobacter senegalensis TaxID=446692 RepID=UPI0012E73CC2|nr:hypothetical protein [Acetobacter senegalensis]
MGRNQTSQWQAILDTSARDYIARFPVGRSALEQVLLRRIDKHNFEENDPALDAAKAALTKVLDDLEQEGAFSATVRLTKERDSLIKRGRSPRVAMRKLAEKGASRDALDDLGAVDPEIEFQAALTISRKRRIGPYRLNPVDRAGIRREEGILARASYRHDIIQRVMETNADDLPDV